MEDQEVKECLKALLEIDNGLTDWEVNFVEAMAHEVGGFTERQAQKILELYDKYCG